MRREINPYERSNHTLLLKKVGTRTVNKQVTEHKEKDEELWHVYFEGNWHFVADSDIEIQYRGEILL